MMKRTLSKTLPSPGKNSSWPQDPSTEKGAIARGEATLATMPFVRPKFDDQESPTKFEWEESDAKPPRHAGWMHDMLKRETDLEDNDNCADVLVLF